MRSDLQAPDRTRQMAAAARNEMQQLQASHEALNASKRFQNFNEQVLEERAIEQQRLEAANLSTNTRLANQAKQILGKQELDNKRRQIEEQDQIRRMQNSQEVIRNQLQLQRGQQDAKALSNFGEQLLNFSETLYKQKAEKINQANQRLEAQGQLDGMLERYGQDNDLLNSVQSLRVANGLRIDNEARQLDREGKYNDATNLRAHNGFYVNGVQEGIAIKGGLELKGYLQAAKDKAIDLGFLNFGDQNADQKLQLFLQEKTIDFMIERGLTALPPETLNKYLAKTLITAQSAVMMEFNEANRAFTIDASIGLARNQIRTSARVPDTFAEDLPNMLTQLFGKDPENFSKNLNKVFEDLKADSKESNSMTSLDTLVTTIKSDERFLAAGQDVISDYLEYEEEFDKAATTNANAAADEISENLKNQFLVTVNSGQITDASGLSKQIAFFSQQASLLPLKQQGPLLEFLNNYEIADVKVVAQSNALFLSEGPTPDEARARAFQYPEMGEEAKRQLFQYADRVEEALENNPEYKSILDQTYAQIELTRPELKNSQLQQHPHIKGQIDTAIDRRQERLKQRFYDWASDGQGDKAPKDLQEWLQLPAQKQLIESPIRVSTTNLGRGQRVMAVPELKVDLGEYEQGAQFTRGDDFPTGLTLTEIDFTDGKKAVFYTTPNLRSRARSGGFGVLDSERGVFLTRPEVMEMGASYEATGAVDPLLRDLSAQANTTPRRFLNDQGTLLGMQGSIEEPKEVVIPTNPTTGVVSRSTAETFAQNKGLSRRGAIWFAHVMMSESSGDPTKQHDKENGVYTGYGLFAHRLSRRDQLFAFVEAKGKDKSDPVVQMEFALYELETYYGSIYNLLTSANPGIHQLIAAQEDWMRYHRKHKASRAQSLKDQLERN